MKQGNIGKEEELKFVMIGYYWDDTTVDKIIEFLCKY